MSKSLGIAVMGITVLMALSATVWVFDQISEARAKRSAAEKAALAEKERQQMLASNRPPSWLGFPVSTNNSNWWKRPPPPPKVSIVELKPELNIEQKNYSVVRGYVLDLRHAIAENDKKGSAVEQRLRKEQNDRLRPELVRVMTVASNMLSVEQLDELNKLLRGIQQVKPKKSQ